MSSQVIETSLKSAIKAHQNGDIKLAKALYVEILIQDENNVQALCNLALVYKQSGSFSLALSNLNKAISIAPNHVPSYINLATLYQDMKEYKKAIDIYKQALYVVPDNANLCNLLGIVYEKVGNDTEAMYFYKEALKRDTKFVKAYNNIGVILYKQKRFDAACEIFKMALAVDKNYLPTYTNLGAAYNKAKRYEEAESILNEAIMIDDRLSGAHANLGNVYNKIKRYDEALHHHQKALQLDSKSASNHANIGITYKNLHRYEEAEKALQEAIMIDHDFINAHFDLATTYLLLGKYEKGFMEYEWRFKKEEMRTLISEQNAIGHIPLFRLDADCDEKTLLLYTEQGYGDILQFVRFVKLLKAKHPKLMIKLQVRDALKTLFKEIAYIDEVITRDKNPGEIDYQLALMSLPYLLKTTVETLPQDIPYIAMPKGKIDLDTDQNKLNVGIVWGASNTGESYTDKVFSLSYFTPMMDDEEIVLYSLQVAGDVTAIKELGVEDKVVDLESKLTDFKQTALAINKLDLVITSDTSVAHLAGALGKEAWVVLQKNADWRWGLEADKTVWYPSLQLIRQDKQGDWESAFVKVYKKIEERKNR